jgi:Putative adhesin
MGSPVPAPPPIREQRLREQRRQRRSVAGPVVLILLGFVLLLTTMHVLHPEPLLRWFGTYWPALIILWGVIKLVEYQQAQREGTRPSGIGAGGVVLLIFLIVFGMSATQASRFNWDEIRDHINLGDEDFQIFGHTYTYDDQLQQDFPAGASLRISNDRGAVNLTASDDNQIHVTAHKRINADRQQEADKINPGTKPQITVSDHTVTLNANTQGAGDHSVATDLDVRIPRTAALVITARRGDVSVLGRDGDVEISSQGGEVAASDINGKVSLNLSHGTARISKISNDVSVQGRADDISAADIKGAARLSGEFDNVKLSRIAGAVSFKSARTDMEFSKLDGDLDMDSGDMRASELTGPFRLLTRSKDVRLAGVNGDVRLQNENGAVEIRMNKLGSMQVSNRNSDIQIYLPDKTAFQLDAHSRGGEIESDFDALKIDNGNDQATASGTIGTGGPHLVITNEHGGIELRKGSSVAEISTPSKPPHPPVPPKVPVPTEN